MPWPDPALPDRMRNPLIPIARFLQQVRMAAEESVA